MTIRRVVFDTSTLVSAALLPYGIPYQALHSALRFCDVCASKDTLEELRKVLARGKFRRYMPDSATQEFVRMMEINVRTFAVSNLDCFSSNPSCRDPADDKFLALAFECEADAIVSSDEDLLALHPWAEIRILRPAEFLNEYR